MRIVHVIDSLDPAGGGPPAVALRLAAAQAGLGHEALIACYVGAQAIGAINGELAQIPHADRVAVERIRAGGRLEMLLARRARKVVRAVVSQSDVVHIHGVWEPILRIAAGIASAMGVPYTVAPHGMLDPWSLRQKAFKKKLAMRFGYRRMLDRAAFLHVLNVDERRLLSPLALQAPCEVIPNGVFIEEFEPLPSPEAFYARHPQVRPGPIILFLSRLHYKKGLDYLADAFGMCARRHADVQLVVAGPDSGARADFSKRVRAAGLDGRVHLIGPVFGQDRLAALAAASCFCLPSRQEGFSVAVAEAMACGLPVVISDACHFPEVAQAHAGMIVPLDASQIGEALLKLLADPPAAARMGQSGRELVRSRFTWPVIAAQSVAAYERALGRSPSPA